MNESFRSTPPGQQWSGSNPANGQNGSFGHDAPPKPAEDGAEVGKALLVGLLGGLVSAAGYMIYRRLPDEQKERLNAQVRTVVAARINEIRTNFNI
jgi:hypothetical protein